MTRPKAGERCGCCGRLVEHPRNVGRHQAFFAMLRPALANWPERHAFQPVDTEDLRSWLLCKARWCTVERIEIAGTAGPQRREVLAMMHTLNDLSRRSNEISDAVALALDFVGRDLWTNGFGVLADPVSVRSHLLAARRNIDAALKTLAETSWPSDADYDAFEKDHNRRTA